MYLLCSVFVLLLSSSLHSLFILYTAKPKYGERETGYIFAIFDCGCVIMSSS